MKTSERRTGYKSVGDVTSIVSEYAVKHSTTRFVTLRKVAVRLILNFLPKTAGFRDLKKTPRYEQVKIFLSICSMFCDRI